MKERPILFNGPMVRAILEGRKTQTRRVVKPQPEDLKEVQSLQYHAATGQKLVVGNGCHFGVPGDRLWVRETWQLATGAIGDLGAAVRYRDMSVAACWMPENNPYPLAQTWNRWRPSIHMPRWASRLTLEITAVRVERLQDISEEDVWEEGCAKPSGYFGCPGQAQAIFRSLWESVCGYGSWASNPYVWVVEFRKVEDKR